ncbi:Uncharacterised protein [Mycobacterium tuberculosis]|nr:Uncharacterised protein [Mycobacterium tuberculosis]
MVAVANISGLRRPSPFFTSMRAGIERVSLSRMLAT